MRFNKFLKNPWFEFAGDKIVIGILVTTCAGIMFIAMESQEWIFAELIASTQLALFFSIYGTNQRCPPMVKARSLGIFPYVIAVGLLMFVFLSQSKAWNTAGSWDDIEKILARKHPEWILLFASCIVSLGIFRSLIAQGENR